MTVLNYSIVADPDELAIVWPHLNRATRNDTERVHYQTDPFHAANLAGQLSNTFGIRFGVYVGVVESPWDAPADVYELP